MIQLQQNGSDLGQTLDVFRPKRPLSERKLQANRANAQRSTGPRTEAGKAVSSRNALKHGILSCALDLGAANSAANLSSLAPHVPTTDAALREIHRIWDRLARVLALEHECTESADDLQRNARLICRYESMLTRQLHAHLRKLAGLNLESSKPWRRNL